MTDPDAVRELLSGRQSDGSSGFFADMVIFDPEKPWVIDAEKLRSKSKNTPFDGKPMQGLVWRTVVAGLTIFENEDLS